MVRLSQPHRENTPLTPCGQFGLVWIDDEFPPRGGDAAFLEVEDLESGRRALHSGEKPKYFHRLLAAAHPDSTHIARELWREAKELHLIFSSMLRK